MPYQILSQVCGKPPKRQLNLDLKFGSCAGTSTGFFGVMTITTSDPSLPCCGYDLPRAAGLANTDRNQVLIRVSSCLTPAPSAELSRRLLRGESRGGASG